MYIKYMLVNKMGIRARLILFRSYVVRLNAKHNMYNAKCLMPLVGWTSVVVSRSTNLVTNIKMGTTISRRQYTRMIEGLDLAKVKKHSYHIQTLARLLPWIGGPRWSRVEVIRLATWTISITYNMIALDLERDHYMSS